MKKILCIMLSLSMLMLSGCGNSRQADNQPKDNEQKDSVQKSQKNIQEMPKEASSAGKDLSQNTSPSDSDREGADTLIVYFSQSGNTEQIASFIQTKTGADLFRITTAEPYPEDLDELYRIGQSELDANARPELEELVENMADYDTVFLGYPIWGGTCPMAVFSFVEQHDFSGKTVIPFCTHGGSGFASSVGDLQDALPDGVVLQDGFSVSGTSASDSQGEVEAWIDHLEME